MSASLPEVTVYRTTTTRIRLAAALAALALTAGGLAGCSLIPNPVKDIVENGGGDSGNDNPLGSLPADWPSEVPVVDGTILVGLKTTDTAWGATILVADEAAAKQSTTLLESAGFTPLFEGSTSYENDRYTVVVQWGDTDDGYTIAYVVVQK
ncbi:hypothetical protein [Protaetiibacter intestinalis]|uniref:Uncharacterized protein n=1 Tax=Protaetiibacter intestinalis TaxID=2419774 RepID=A0A387BIY4_9MICO|nr:hypothetical protein [Protaetiibacter intestinalis]AYF98490.1 hypothetical protein D7I47_09625 [Protaetiibacter intestinalis]